MASSLNKVFIMGRLGFDPEVRYTPNQTAVATLRVATSEFFTREGQRQEQTEWHRIVVWGRQAENCAKYLAKGRNVFIEGRLQTRAWDDKSGQKRYTTEIVANNVQFIGPNTASTTATASSGPHEEDRHQEARFPQAESNGDYSAPSSYGSHNESAVNFDDIPF